MCPSPCWQPFASGRLAFDDPDSVLVIAWGNPLREDDAVAWHVLEGLRSLKPRPRLPALHLRHAHQLTPEIPHQGRRLRRMT